MPSVVAAAGVFAVAIVVPAGVIATTGVARVTPLNGGMVGGTFVVVDTRPGEQLDPHVSGDLAAYTDQNGGSQVIRFYDFSDPASSGVIPKGLGDFDSLSNVDGTRIAFSRQRSDNSRACMIFDKATLSTTEIAPGSNLFVFGTALGGDTVAFIDTSLGDPEIILGSISAPGAPVVNLSLSSDFDTSPAVSPAGTAVVWERCDSGFTNCGIMRSIFSGGTWGPSEVVADTPSHEENPDTDAVNVVYDSDRATSVGGPDIYFQPLAGGPETQLQINGVQRNPGIDQGVIAFESAPTFASAGDVYVYVIATNRLWRVTDTPAINESLNDITVLPNGDVRVIWAANDGLTGDNNIYARTFTIPLGGGDTTAPSVAIATPADGALYLKDQAVAASYSCEDEPDGSGLASCDGTVADGELIDTAAVGPHSFTVVGTDNAGNSAAVTHTYTVIYDFSGFFPPVESLPALNIVTAGQAIPVKVSLGGDQGLGILAAGYPASSPIACDASEPGTVIEETVTAGASSLQYCASSERYTYVWKTNKSWRGTCRMLVVRLDDNTAHLAKFRFR